MPENAELIEDVMPSWINPGFMENILRKHHNDQSIKVEDVTVKMAIPKGEGYASVMYRVYAKYHHKKQRDIKRSFVIKSLPSDAIAQKKLGEYNVHEKEMEIYQKILPELKKLLRAVNENGDLFPECLGICNEQDVIIFEDLSTKKYVMLSRYDGLDMTCTKMALELLAKMHASSMKLCELHKGILSNYKTGMFNRESDAFNPFFYSNFDALVNEISSWEDYKYYADKLKNMRSSFIENSLKVFDHDHEDDLRALVHGDLWINNFMYKFDDNKRPVDVLMLDFQLSTYASPIIDLLYFFFTSPANEIKQECFEELVQYYYLHLADALRRLNYSKKILTLNEFWQQLGKKYFYAFISACVIFPVMINEDAANADFEALMSNDERSKKFKKTVMSNPKVHRVLKKWLPIFDKKGMLDQMWG